MMMQKSKPFWQLIFENMAFHYANDVIEVNVDTKNADKIDVKIALNSGKVLKLHPDIKDSLIKVDADMCHALIGNGNQISSILSTK